MKSASEKQELNHQDDSLPYLVLEITNGQTNHRLRPILSNRYLIGSAPTCHLQLGESSLAPLHSIILVGPESAEIDTVASSPELIINGIKRDSATLHQGDEIEIGQIKFQVHLQESIEEQMENSQDQPYIVPFPEVHSSLEVELQEQEENLSELSVEELVDRIEEEEQLIQKYEDGLETGLSALLHEAGITEEQIKAVSTEETNSNIEWERLRAQLAQIIEQTSNESSSLDEVKLEKEEKLEQVVIQLYKVAEELEQRSEIICEREKEYSEASEALLSSQETLSKQLDYLLAKAEELNSDENPGQSRRASA